MDDQKVNEVFYFQSSNKHWEEIDLNNEGFLFPCLFFHCKYLYTTDQMLEGNVFVKMSLSHINLPLLCCISKTQKIKSNYLSHVLVLS